MNAFVPAYDCVNIFWMKDIMMGELMRKYTLSLTCSC